jgi:hypothetical protein
MLSRRVLSCLILIALLLCATLADAAWITKKKNRDGSTHYELIETPDTSPSSQLPRQSASENITNAAVPVSPPVVTPVRPNYVPAKTSEMPSRGQRRSRHRSSNSEEE